MYPNMPGMPPASSTPAMPGLPVPPRPGVREALPGLIGLIAALVGGGRAGGAGFAQTWGQRLQAQEAERQEALRDQALMAQRQAERAAAAAQQRQQAKVKFLTDVQGQLSDFKTKAQADQFLDFAEQMAGETFPELGRGALRRIVRYIAPDLASRVGEILKSILADPRYKDADTRNLRFPIDMGSDGAPDAELTIEEMRRLAPHVAVGLDIRTGRIYQPPVKAADMSVWERAEAELMPIWAAEKGHEPTEAERPVFNDRVVARMNQWKRAEREATDVRGPEDMDQAEDIAGAIESGIQPPDLTRLYRFSGPVRAALARRGYDLSKANIDWLGTTQYIRTLNQTQQVRLRQAVNFAYESLDIIDELASQWKAGRFPILNKAVLATAVGGAYGTDAQQIATKLRAQISDLVSELATVYKGGYASTDDSLKLAEQQLKAEWAEPQLKSAVDLVRRNLKIRLNSLRNTGVVAGPDNIYAPRIDIPGRESGGTKPPKKIGRFEVVEVPQ